MKPSTSTIASFEEKLQELHTDQVQLEKKISTISILRLAVIVLGVTASILLFQYQYIVLSYLSSTGMVVGFIYLVIQFQTENRNLHWLKNYIKYLENEVTCFHHQDSLYQDGTSFIQEGHDYADDLDIFGKQSLFHIINRSKSFKGLKHLADRFLQPLPLEEIQTNQEVIKALQDERAWRHQFHRYLLDIDQSEGQDIVKHLYPFKDVSFPPFMKWYARLAPWIWLIATIGFFFFDPVFKPLVFIIPLLNWVMIAIFSGKVAPIHESMSNIGSEMKVFILPARHIIHHVWKHPQLESYTQKLKSKDGESIAVLKKVSRLTSLFDLRLNLLMAPLLNTFLVWDLNMVVLFEKLVREKNLLQKLEDYLEVIGIFESLSSLANFNDIYPHYQTPQVKQTDSYYFSAKEMGHPLIPSSQRVYNDYTLQGQKRVDIVTGSNMAGKSTFLRTVGINMILAYTGASVCAQSLEVSYHKVFTYMRIKDSLKESTSTFKAEIDRLKQLLSLANQKAPYIYLIDEMLRGTNSNDKLKGSISVVKSLLNHQATAIIATHDLKLAELGNQSIDEIQNYHFDIQLTEHEDMSFDYKLHAGICKTFNASILLKQIGIKIED